MCLSILENSLHKLVNPGIVCLYNNYTVLYLVVHALQIHVLQLHILVVVVSGCTCVMTMSFNNSTDLLVYKINRLMRAFNL